MAKLTYIKEVVNKFAAVGAAVNVKLASESLPELKDWFKGEPVVIRESNTPFAFWDLIDPDEVGLLFEAVDAGDVTVAVMVTLVIGAATPAELLDLIADIAPTVVAAIEADSESWPYELRARAIAPGPRSTRKGVVRMVDLVFGIGFIKRDWGDVL